MFSGNGECNAGDFEWFPHRCCKKYWQCNNKNVTEVSCGVNSSGQQMIFDSTVQANANTTPCKVPTSSAEGACLNATQCTSSEGKINTIPMVKCYYEIYAGNVLHNIHTHIFHSFMSRWDVCIRRMLLVQIFFYLSVYLFIHFKHIQLFEMLSIYYLFISCVWLYFIVFFFI